MNEWALSGRNANLPLAAIFAVCVVAVSSITRMPSPSPSSSSPRLALAGLAWVIGLATEAVGARFGPALTGLLQSTLGNLPELFVVLFALGAGEIVVAQTSILGSLFANALLVLGLAIVAGSMCAEDGVMRFRARLPNDTATLLLLAASSSFSSGCRTRSAIGRASMRLRFPRSAPSACSSSTAFWLWGYLRSDEEPAVEEGGHAPFSSERARVLAVAGVAAAFVSDWFVDALDPAVESLGISKAFAGLVIVGIAGNAVENVVGITLAAKGHADLAISVVKNSVAQIARSCSRRSCLLSLFFEHRLTFVLAPGLHRGAGVMAIAVWQITGDGEAVAFEGWALVALYIVLAVLTFYE